MKKQLNICLIGAKGRLGTQVTYLLHKNEHLALAYPLTRDSTQKQVKDAFIHSDMILDLSTANSLNSHIKYALSYKKPFVTGITGLTKDHFSLLKKASHTIPIFYSSNFSGGIALLKKLLKQLPHNYSIKIKEKHHKWKKDSPSGTALNLKKSLPESTPISSIREGEIIGEHTIELNSPYETLTFKHTAKKRKLFAIGAIEALIYLGQKPPGYYTSIHD